MPNMTWRLVRWSLGTAVVIFAGRSIAANWHTLREQPVAWSISVLPIALALLLTWAVYATLVQAWRVMLAGWGERLGFLPSARIWTISSLGKYVPGQVWAIASMAVMAQRAGVAPWAATGSSILLQGLAVGTGAAILAATGTTLLERQYPWAGTVVLVLLAASVCGVVTLLWPPFVRRVLRQFRLDAPGRRQPSLPHMLVGAVVNAAAWIGYGAALWLLARGLVAAPALTPRLAVGAFVASYLSGFLAFGVPAGLGVREIVFVATLQGALGLPVALALAAASRVMLTVADFGAAAPFLVSARGSTRAAI